MDEIELSEDCSQQEPGKLIRVHVRARKRLYSLDWTSTRLRNFKLTNVRHTVAHSSLSSR
eukprot:3476804-Amphidinium_carterae.1